MPQPVFDDGDVVAGLDEVQGGGMPKGVRGDFASLQRRAFGGRAGCMQADPASDAEACQGISTGIAE
jgi:hypothetical protein